MKPLIISIILVIAFVSLALFAPNRAPTKGNGNLIPAEKDLNIVDGKQVIGITARGGYFPRANYAKAGIPTILKVKTNGTYDCSLALNIPSLGFRKNLPMTGETEIDLGSPKAGSVIQGMCAMGMYRFEIRFN